jgi:hypothetical protein
MQGNRADDDDDDGGSSDDNGDNDGGGDNDDDDINFIINKFQKLIGRVGTSELTTTTSLFLLTHFLLHSSFSFPWG